MLLSKIIDRLVWLGFVTAAIVAVGIASVLALVLGVDHTRVGLVIGGALIVVIFVLLIYVRTHRRRVPRRPKPSETYEAEFASAEAGWLHRPPSIPIQSPQLMWQPVETTGHDVPGDTRPMNRVQAEQSPSIQDGRPFQPSPLIEEPPLDPVEDTKPTRPEKPTPVYTVSTPGHGPYDDLFPPPQPGDEDYLEYNPEAEATAKTSTHVQVQSTASTPPDEQPTVPMGPVTPAIEPPSVRDAEPDQAEQTAESARPEHPEQADDGVPAPPDNSPA